EGTLKEADTCDPKALVILAGRNSAPPSAAPSGFRVVAFVNAYNEADVIAPSLEALFRQGLEVHLLDNWSTDGTERIAERYLDRGLLQIERFPPEGRRPRYEHGRMLQRITELAETLKVDWAVVNDADEVRQSPWSGVPLRDAIYTVDRRGFNAIDYTVLLFEPTDDGFPDGGNLEYFRHFHFGDEPWHLLRINTWKRLGRTVNLVDSGGHEAQFEGRRVFPYKFLMKHYGVRSQRHGVKKVFLERKARFVDEERARGWHVHYDQILEGESFIQDPRTLISFDPRRFDRDFLIERLSGIGIEPASGAASLTIRSDNAPVDSFYRVEGRGKNLEEVAEKALGESSTAARGNAQRYARS